MKNTSESTSEERPTPKTMAIFHEQAREALVASEKRRWQGWRSIAIGAVLIAATVTLLPTVAAFAGSQLLAGSIAVGVTAFMGIVVGANGYRTIHQAHAEKQGIVASYTIAQQRINQPEYRKETAASVEETTVESQRWRDKILNACGRGQHIGH